MTDMEEIVGAAHLLTRRQFVMRGTQAALAARAAAGALPALAEAGLRAGQGAPISGTLKFATYPQWVGSHEYAGFHKLYPQAKVKEIATSTTSTNGRAILVRQNPDAYDFMLLGLSAGPILAAKPSLDAKLDYSHIPNIKYVPRKFRQQYPYGIPTDYGKIGLAYRKDLITERPTSWADFWRLAPKYSGKVIIEDTEEDVIGNTLIMLGYAANSIVPSELAKAKAKLLEIKPHLQAFLNTNISKPLIQGSAVMSMDYDFSIAAARAQEPNIVWVTPKEGLMAYLEGWAGIATSKNLRTVEAFMNYHLAPKNYADFVNTTDTAYIEAAATPYVKKSVASDPILAFDKQTVARLSFEKFKGADGTKRWAEVWAEVKAG
jgi:spermidine/putrescine transport system substrate-binding protein